MQNQHAILSSMLNRLLKLSKNTVLFTLALILSVTSLTTLIVPKAGATSLPNVVADPTFNVGIGASEEVMTIATQSDGKILAGGLFTSFDASPQNHLIRLNPDGSKDTSFDIGTGFDNAVLTMIVQLDSKILVGGPFSNYNGSPQKGLIRLNPDGSKDTSFDIGTGFGNVVNTIVLQPDGKILVGGAFTTYKGLTQNRFIRLNPDGSKDTSFDIGTGFGSGSIIYTIAIGANSKILVGGDFAFYNGFNRKNIISIDEIGSMDNSFNDGTGFSSALWTIVPQSNGKIMVGGYFYDFNGTNAPFIAKIFITPDRDQDGTDDQIEDSSPNSGDANNDGTLDSNQPNVGSFINPVTNQPMTIEVDSQCSLTGVSTNPSTNNSTQDTNFNYPLGLYNFTANCGTLGYTTNFKAYYYNADTTKNYTLRKYNPNTNTYATIDTATFNVETIAGQPVLTATYTITDGSSLDTDNQANGTILDPAGPALTNPTTATPATLPTAPNTGVKSGILGQVLVIIVGVAGILVSLKYFLRYKSYKIYK